MTVAEVVGTDASSTAAKTTARVWLERFDYETAGTTEIVVTLEDPEPAEEKRIPADFNEQTIWTLAQIAYSGSERRIKSLRLPNAEAAVELAAALLRASGHAGGHNTDPNSYTAGYIAGLRHAWGTDGGQRAVDARDALRLNVRQVRAQGNLQGRDEQMGWLKRILNSRGAQAVVQAVRGWEIRNEKTPDGNR